MVLGWLTALFGKVKDDRLGHVQYPGGEYHSQVEAIRALLDAGFTANEWASFDARDAGGDWATVQVRGDSINTLTEPVDLPAVLRAAGLDALAARARIADAAGQRREQAHDPQWMERPVEGTLFALPGATTAELADAVNAIFRQRHAFSSRYALSGSRES